MKKAFLDQLFLGFLLFTGVVTFIATVNDERATRDKAYELQSLVTKSSQAMARSYERNLDMCLGKITNTNILNETLLGTQLLEAGNNINFEYEYYDTSGDGEPDTVTTTLTGYKVDTFWYRFFDKDSFSLGEISWSEAIDAPKDITLRWDTMPDAGYENIMGTYELDSNGCVTNMQMHMANSKDEDKWSEIDDATGEKVAIVDGVTSPPTYIFSVADGHRLFNYPSDNSAITLEEDHCMNDGTYPKITINGVTMQGIVGDTHSGNVFFEHVELNADGFEHYHIIPKTIYQDFVDYKNDIYNADGNEQDKYEAFKNYVDTVLNVDNDPDNDIDYTTDPNDEYKYALEDLDAANSDFDFSDMLLDGTRVVKSNEVDKYSVDDHTGKITFDDDYCQDFNNYPPELIITGCPLTVLEDTPTSAIGWTASDSDGTVVSKETSSTHGEATVNINGTITYTPDLNFFGEDTLTIIAKDDDDAITKRECLITITEVNDAPTISGEPETSAYVDTLYDFTPTAADVDGDTLSFNITNIPAWASFDESTGQLTGTPEADDVNVYSNIVITVSDGRGGSASLPAFEIEVIGDGKPYLVSEIPDQTISVGDTYSYNLSPHFADPDGDTLSYKVTIIKDGTIQGSLDLGNSGLLESTNIANAYKGDIFTLEVTVSDGTNSVSDTYTLEITDGNSYYHTFDSDNEGWSGRSGWEEISNDGKLKITSNSAFNNRNANFDFNFGAGNADKNVTIEFDMYHKGGWESSGTSEDFFRVKLNGTQVVESQYSGPNSNTIYGPYQYTITGITDSSGNIEVRLIINVSYSGYSGEIAYIDNISVKLQ